MAFLNYPSDYDQAVLHKVKAAHSVESCLSIFKNSVNKMPGIESSYAQCVNKLTASTVKATYFYAPIYDARFGVTQFWTTEHDKTVKNNSKYTVESSSPGQIMPNYTTYNVTQSYDTTVTKNHEANKKISFLKQQGTPQELCVLDKTAMASSNNTRIASVAELKFPLYHSNCIISINKLATSAANEYRTFEKKVSITSSEVDVYFVPILYLTFTFNGNQYKAQFNMYNGAIHHDVVASGKCKSKAYHDQQAAIKLGVFNKILCVATVLFNLIFAFSVKGKVFWDVILCIYGAVLLFMGLLVGSDYDYMRYERFYAKHGADKRNTSYIKHTVKFVVAAAINIILHIILGS